MAGIKDYAQGAFNHAVQTRKIKRVRICSKCGREGLIEGHHPNYNKPLEVLWLCRKCHANTPRVKIMNYRQSQKRIRNAALVRYYKENPHLSFEEIGDFFNITKQRVYQILIYNHACHNCRYLMDKGFCECRDPVDMIRKINQCPDWKHYRNGENL